MGYKDSVSIEGFLYFLVCRPISRNNRYFGGIAILYKSCIKNGIKNLHIRNTSFHWVLFKKDVFHLNNNIYLCTVYYPPSGSAICRMTVKFFSYLKRSFFSYQNSGDVILCRDFNARCGTENDFVTNNLDNFVPIDSNYVADSSRIRNNRES